MNNSASREGSPDGTSVRALNQVSELFPISLDCVLPQGIQVVGTKRLLLMSDAGRVGMLTPSSGNPTSLWKEMGRCDTSPNDN